VLEFPDHLYLCLYLGVQNHLRARWAVVARKRHCEVFHILRDEAVLAPRAWPLIVVVDGSHAPAAVDRVVNDGKVGAVTPISSTCEERPLTVINGLSASDHARLRSLHLAL